MAGDAYQGRPSLVMVPQVPKPAKRAPAPAAPSVEDAVDVTFA